MGKREKGKKEWSVLRGTISRIRVARGKGNEQKQDQGRCVLQGWTKPETELAGIMNMKIFTLNAPSDLGNGFKK